MHFKLLGDKAQLRITFEIFITCGACASIRQIQTGQANTDYRDVCQTINKDITL